MVCNFDNHLLNDALAVPRSEGTWALEMLGKPILNSIPFRLRRASSHAHGEYKVFALPL